METLEWVPELEESFDYCGSVDLMCGPSAEERGVAAQQSSMFNTLAGNYATVFGDQQAILSELNQSLSPIIAAGPNQQGMNAAQLAALNTQAINSNAAAARNAIQAAQSRAGAGSPSGLPTGIDTQISQAINAAETANLANAQLGITNENYNLGRQQYNTALGQTENLAQLENPVPYAGQATSAGSQAFQSQDKISQEQNQRESELAGGIAGLGMDAATFGLGAALGAGPAGLSPLQSGLFSLGGGGFQ